MSCEICSEVLAKGGKIEDHSDSESEQHEFESCEIYPCVECDKAFRARCDYGKVVIVDTSRRDSFVFVTSSSEMMGNKKLADGGDDDSDSSSCVTFEKVHLEGPETESDAQSRN